MPIRILELRSVWGTGGGPDKTILLGAARSDPARFAVTACYIRDARDPAFAIGALAREMGVDYEELVERHSWDPGLWRSLRQLVRRRGYDVVHAHDYKTDVLAWLLSRVERVVPLSTAHFWSGTSARERLVYFPADRWLLSKYPRVVAVSEEVRRELLASGTRAERITVIPNGIDAEAFSRDPAREKAVRADLDIPAGAFVVGSICRLEPIKRVDLLVDAFARLREKRADAVLVIAGAGAERDSLQRRAERTVPGACRFLGFRRDVSTLHHAFNVFVQASDGEGTSNAVLEAMSMETAVVATDVGGTRSQIRDGIDGLLIAPGDAAALHQALEHTAADREATMRRVASARRRILDEFSFAVRMARLERVYDELMESSRRA